MIMKMFGDSRLGRYLKKRCYDEETGFLLNYVTLVISEPEIKKQLFNHKGEQFKRIIWPITVSLVLSFLQTVYDLYFLKTGHPIWIVTASLDLLLLVFFWILIKKNKAPYCSVGAIAYFF